MSDLADPSVPRDAAALPSTSEHDGAPSAAPVHDVEASPAFTVSPARPAATPEMDALLEPGLCLGSVIPVPVPKGSQFPLVPAPPPGDKR